MSGWGVEGPALFVGWRNAVVVLLTRIILNMGKWGQTIILAPTLLHRGGAVDLDGNLIDYLTLFLPGGGADLPPHPPNSYPYL